jgi:hypothetical protein
LLIAHPVPERSTEGRQELASCMEVKAKDVVHLTERGLAGVLAIDE